MMPPAIITALPASSTTRPPASFTVRLDTSLRPNPNFLVIVDPVTALVTPIGRLGVGLRLTDIAIDPTTGIMYAISEFNQNFYTINTSTGQAVQIGQPGLMS